MLEEEIKVQLSEKQLAAFNLLRDDNGISEICYGGGGRGGKSYVGSAHVVMTGLEHEGMVSFVARQELKRLKRTTVSTMLKFCRAANLTKDVDYTYSNHDSIMHLSRNNGDFDGGSMVLFEELKHKPTDKSYDRLGSYDLSFVWIDEAQEINVAARDQLKSRLTLLKGQNFDGTNWKLPPKSLYTCNPAKNWIYHDYVRPNQKGSIEAYRKFISALYDDNPFINQESYRNSVLESKNPVMIQRLLYGNFDYDDGDDVLLDYDAILDLFTNSHVPIDLGQKCISADVAMMGNDRFMIGVWYGKVLVEYKSIAKANGAEVKDAIQAMKDKHGIPNRRIVYDADGLGAYLDGFFVGAYAFHANAKEIPTRKTSQNRKKETKPQYENLKAQCHYKLVELTNESEMWLKAIKKADETMVIEEFEQIKRRDPDKDGPMKLVRKEVVKATLGRSPDFSDMCAMRCVFFLPQPKRNRITATAVV